MTDIPYVITEDPEVREYLKAQEEEYGTYAAAAPIDASPGVRAFNVGDRIPKSTVERLGLQNHPAVHKLTKAERESAAGPTSTVDTDAGPSTSETSTAKKGNK